MQANKFNDEKIENAVALILQYGVILAAVVVAIGFGLFLIRHGLNYATPDYLHFHGEPEKLISFSGIYHSLISGRPIAIIEFGLMILVATPIIRVAYSVWGYSMQRDRIYTIISLIVLAVLLISIFRAV